MRTVNSLEFVGAEAEAAKLFDSELLVGLGQ